MTRYSCQLPLSILLPLVVTYCLSSLQASNLKNIQPNNSSPNNNAEMAMHVSSISQSSMSHGLMAKSKLSSLTQIHGDPTPHCLIVITARFMKNNHHNAACNDALHYTTALIKMQQPLIESQVANEVLWKN